MDRIKVKSHKKDYSKKRNFYVALGICLMAVGIASFVTYNNVKNYMFKDTTPTRPVEMKQTKSMQNSLNRDEHYGKGASSATTKIGQEKTFGNSKQNSEKNLYSTDEIPVKAKKAGKICYPCDNKDISKSFSNENPVFSKTFNDWRIHNGVDFPLEKDSQIFAAADGKVTNIFDDPNFGITMEIEHDGKFTALYSGLNENTLVKAGEKVEAGQSIGTLDKIPSEMEDGYHLHFAIKKSEKFVDPIEILGKIN